jgi:hypothetical protein
MDRNTVPGRFRKYLCNPTTMIFTDFRRGIDALSVDDIDGIDANPKTPEVSATSLGQGPHQQVVTMEAK